MKKEQIDAFQSMLVVLLDALCYEGVKYTLIVHNAEGEYDLTCSNASPAESYEKVLGLKSILEGDKEKFN